MGYRDILMEIAEGPRAREQAEAAAALAVRFNASLTGVFAKSRIPFPFIPPESFGLTTTEMQRLLDAYDGAVRKARDAAKSAFDAAVKTAGVESDWLEVEDLRDLVGCARRVDLVVASEDDAVGLSTADLAMAAGGPVLLLPAAGPGRPIGSHVLVAWNGSREASHALRGAWPFLEAAERVDVLVVSRKGEGGPEGLLQRHFARHGVRPNLIVEEADDASAGEIIQTKAAMLGADLVVMGLYGRTRVQELVLGGASRQMLRHATTPLLVSH